MDDASAVGVQHGTGTGTNARVRPHASPPFEAQLEERRLRMAGAGPARGPVAQASLPCWPPTAPHALLRRHLGRDRASMSMTMQQLLDRDGATGAAMLNTNSTVAATGPGSEQNAAQASLSPLLPPPPVDIAVSAQGWRLGGAGVPSRPVKIRWQHKSEASVRALIAAPQSAPAAAQNASHSDATATRPTSANVDAHASQPASDMLSITYDFLSRYGLGTEFSKFVAARRATLAAAPADSAPVAPPRVDGKSTTLAAPRAVRTASSGSARLGSSGHDRASTVQPMAAATTTTTTTANTTTTAPRRPSTPQDVNSRRNDTQSADRPVLPTAPAPTSRKRQREDVGDDEFSEILASLRAPIDTRGFSRDEAPWDTVDVCGHTIHRFLCHVDGADGTRRHEVVGLVRSELVELLGEPRIDEMRAPDVQTAAPGAAPSAAPNARQNADGAAPGAAPDAIKIDWRIFASLQCAGVGTAKEARTRHEAARALAQAPPLTELSMALALMRLKKYRIVTLARKHE